MIKQKILARIEGEASLEYEFKNKKIDFVKIKFMNFRGMEEIIKGRPPLDAMALTPRVCGVCGQAHLITTVKTLEDLYKTNGYELELTEKANIIRDLTTGSEILQNHLKWFYFTILSDLFSSNEKYSLGKDKFLKATAISRDLNKIAGMFSGQWPHAAFVRPGGVVSDPVTSNITDGVKILDQMIEFFEKEIFLGSAESFLEVEKYETLLENSAELGIALRKMESIGVSRLGLGYGKFLTINNNCGFISGFFEEGKKHSSNVAFAKESLENTFFVENGYTYSKSALYNNQFVETGPLARATMREDNLVTNLISALGDCAAVRVVARVKELVVVASYLKKRLQELNLQERSFIEPKKPIKDLEGNGVGVFEAARGALIHKVELKNGLIENYDIITPTVWNLGNGSKEYPSTIQKAIIGLDSTKKSEFIFRTFDVCSVCTTQ